MILVAEKILTIKVNKKGSRLQIFLNIGQFITTQNKNSLLI